LPKLSKELGALAGPKPNQLWLHLVGSVPEKVDDNIFFSAKESFWFSLE
jgi:hypothetical protein